MKNPLILNQKYTLEIKPTAPFNFDATFHKPDHFPSADNDWQPGQRWQTMVWQGQPLGLVFADHGSLNDPLIQLTIYAGAELDEAFLDRAVAEVNYRYNLQMDLGGFNHHFQHDSQLGPVIHKWQGMRPISNASLYEYLMITTVLQNATVRRSVNMMQSLFENYGTLLAFDNRELYAFWLPAGIHSTPEQELRGLKVGYRAKTLKRVSAAFVNQEVDEFRLRRESLEQQRKVLMNLYGVGPASVGYLLFDVYHRMDYLETISPWEQKIYSKLFFNTEINQPQPTATLIDYFKQHFSGYRALVVHYIWEDLFWKRKHEKIDWLEKLIRL